MAKSVHASAASMKNSANDVMGTLKKMAGVAAGAFAIKAGAEFTFKTAMNFEDLLAGLHTATGSRGTAEKEFSRLQEYAASTPFKIEEAVSTFTRLKNLNLDSSSRSMNAYGNIAAAIPGKSIMDFTEAVADGVMGEFERLKEFGIKGSKADGNVTLRFRGQEFKAAAKNGEIDPKAVEEQLRVISEKFFSGAMERRSKTFGGAVSNLSDSIQIAVFKMWRAGLDKPVVAAVRSMTEFIQKNMPKIEALGQMAGRLGAQFGRFTKLNLPKIIDGVAFSLKTLHAIAPFAAAGVYLLAIRFAYLKYQAMAAGFAGIIMSINAVGFSSWAAAAGATAMNIAVAWLPTVIAAAIIAVAGFVWDTVNYMNTGKSVLLDFTEQWPWLHKIIKWAITGVIINFGALYDGIKKGVEYWMPALTNAFYYWKSVIDDVWKFLEPKFNDLMGWIGNIANAAGSAFNAVSGLFGAGGDGSGGGAAGAGVSGNMAATARNFAIGAPGQSAADIWAKSAAKVDGMAIRTLYKTGVACAASVEEVARQAGASQQVLNALTPGVESSYHNLLRQGLAELVPYNQLRGGEIFYAPGLTHTGIVGEGGKTFLHAANSQGHKIGMGQRFSSTANYLGSSGKYLRIKPQFMGGTGTQTVQMPVRGGGGPLANPPTAPVTANTPQTFVFNMGLNTSPQSLAQQVGLAAQQGAADGIRNAVTVPTPTRKK